MRSGSGISRSLDARLRVPVVAALLAVAALGTAALGTAALGTEAAATTSAAAAPAAAEAAATTSAAAAPAAAEAATSGSCSGVPGKYHARLVVEPAAGKILARCVGFSESESGSGKEKVKGIPALKLLSDSHVELGTQTYSIGVAICQVDDVPAHYTTCFPSGQDYWALFLSTNGRKWTSPSVGVSDITVPPGGSLGLRYDSPKGNPAPPPPPTPA